MPEISTSTEQRLARRLAATAACAAFALLASYAQVSLARPPSQSTFPSAEAASQALYRAVERGDAAAIATILGAGRDIVSSSDRSQDTRDRGRFIEKYRQMHRLAQEPDATTVLYIGAENWPFPIPLVSEDGAWRFDAERGRDEVLFRRIGENELRAAQVCHALILAQKERPGAERDASIRVLRRLPASATGRGIAFHGYVFRALAGRQTDGAPGSAYVAYPAVHGSTGVMTYLVDQDDVVYAKDLGPDTARIARRMGEYRPDATWHPEE